MEDKVHLTDNNVVRVSTHHISNVQSGVAARRSAININSASLKELLSLSGIGVKRATSIIEHRAINGPFADDSGLLKVSGIGLGIVTKLRDEIYYGIDANPKDHRASSVVYNVATQDQSTERLPVCPSDMLTALLPFIALDAIGLNFLTKWCNFVLHVALRSGNTLELTMNNNKSSFALSTHEAIFFPDDKWPCGSHLLDSKCEEKGCKFAHYDTGLARVLRLIKNAKHKLDVAVHSLTEERLANALVEAHERDVSVRVLTDGTQMEMEGSSISRLSKAGIPVLSNKGEKFHMHHKFAVIDGEGVINGSFNWTAGAVKGNDENIVLSHDVMLARNFTREFDSLWRKFTNGDRAEAIPASLNGDATVLFFPKFGAEMQKLQHELAVARHTINVAMFTFTHGELCDCLIMQHQKGVRVRVVTDRRQAHCNGTSVHRLSNAGIEVRTAAKFFFMHHKFAVIDGMVLINGSLNWTNQAVNGNQENVVMYRNAHKLCAQFTGEFERMWERGSQK